MKIEMKNDTISSLNWRSCKMDQISWGEFIRIDI